MISDHCHYYDFLIIALLHLYFILKDKRVCEQGDSSNTPTPFDTLTPGLCFITRYGVVEVENDDRAIPCYVPESSDQIELTANLRKQMKMFHNAISKRQAREQKHLLNVATMSASDVLFISSPANFSAKVIGYHNWGLGFFEKFLASVGTTKARVPEF